MAPEPSPRGISPPPFPCGLPPSERLLALRATVQGLWQVLSEPLAHVAGFLAHVEQLFVDATAPTSTSSSTGAAGENAAAAEASEGTEVMSVLTVGGARNWDRCERASGWPASALCLPVYLSICHTPVRTPQGMPGDSSGSG